MKFRLPPECLGVTLAGEVMVVAADGTIEAEDAAALVLKSHGLVLVDEANPAPPPSRAKARQDKRP